MSIHSQRLKERVCDACYGKCERYDQGFRESFKLRIDVLQPRFLNVYQPEYLSQFCKHRTLERAFPDIDIEQDQSSE